MQFDIATSGFTFTTASGFLEITGLPFTSQNITGLVYRGPISFGGVNKASYSQLNLNMAANASVFLVNASGMGQAPTPITAADMPTGGSVILVGEIVITVQ